MRTYTVSVLRMLSGFVAAAAIAACHEQPSFTLTSGTRVTLVLDSQPPLHPEVAAALAPVADSVEVVLTVTRATVDSVVGTHTGNWSHFPLQVSDVPGPKPFVATRRGSSWRIDLYPFTIDAGIVLELDAASSVDGGRWKSRDPQAIVGRFKLSAPGA